MTWTPQELERKVRQMDNDVQDIYVMLTGISGHLARQANRLSEIDTKLEAHDLRFDAIDAKMDEHGTHLVAIDGRLDAIDGRLGEIVELLTAS